MAVRQLVIILGALLVLGCETPPSQAPYLPPARPDQLLKVETLLGENKALEAAVVLKNLEPLLDSESPLLERIKEALILQGKAWETEGNFTALRNLNQDLKTLGLPPLDSGNLDQELISGYKKAGWGAPLTLWIQDTLSDLPAEQRLDYARTLRDEGLYLAFKNSIQDLTSKLDEADRNFLESRSTPQNFIKGTVTVMVNKGLKIEGGMGFADIVIGSGFFIDKRGYLLTNYHVIQSEVDPEYEGYSRLFITLPNSKGERIPAKVVGWDPNLDVALLKASVDPAYVFSFASNPGLKEGDRLYAIGSPGGLEATITSGIVSAVGRRFLPLGEALQMDVAVNPGNSGGPLVDEAGWVEGLVFSGIPEFQGVNFAVSGAYIRKMVPLLYQGGAVGHLWLGLGAHDTYEGLEIDFVAKNGPGEKSGVRPGMVLTAVQDVDLVANSEVHLPLLDQRQVVKTTWKDKNGTSHIYLFRERRPENPLEDSFENQPPEDLIPHLFGMSLELQGNPIFRWFRVVNVVAGTSADQIGLAPGDPVQLKSWSILEEEKAVVAQFFVKKRLGGYFESTVEFGAYLQSTRIF